MLTIHSSTEYDRPLNGATSSPPLSADELPNRFSSLRNAVRPRTPFGHSAPDSTPKSASLTAERKAPDGEKARSKFWRAFSHRSRRATPTLKSSNGADSELPWSRTGTDHNSAPRHNVRTVLVSSYFAAGSACNTNHPAFHRNEVRDAGSPSPSTAIQNVPQV